MDGTLLMNNDTIIAMLSQANDLARQGHNLAAKRLRQAARELINA